MPLGSAAGEKRGRKKSPQDIKSLHLGNEHAKAVQRMSHVLPAKTEDDTGNWWIINLRQRRPIQLSLRGKLDVGQLVGRAGKHHGGMGVLFPVVVKQGRDLPAFRGLLDPDYAGAETDAFPEQCLQRVSEDLQTMIEGNLGGILLGRLAALLSLASPQDLAQNQRAISLLQNVQLGEGIFD